MPRFAPVSRANSARRQSFYVHGPRSRHGAGRPCLIEPLERRLQLSGELAARVAFINATSPQSDAVQQLCVLDLPSRTPAVVPNIPAQQIGPPAWSPDGNWIAFEVGPPSSSQIALIAPNGSGYRALTSPGDKLTSPAFSPDGAKLAFNRYYGDVFILDLTTGHTTDLGFGGTRVQWSPDGTKLAYTDWSIHSYGSGGIQSNVFIYDLATRISTLVTNTHMGIAYNSVAWSPDGARLAMSKVTQDYWGNGVIVRGRNDIVVVPVVDPTAEVNLTADLSSTGPEYVDPARRWAASNPAWTVDGTHIIFEYSAAGQHALWSMAADGSEKAPLPDMPGHELTPAVAPTVTISGSVYHDVDGNGRRGRAERKLARRRVFIDSNNNGIRDAGERSAVTDAAGNFTLPGVGLGIQHLRTAPPHQWRSSPPDGLTLTLTRARAAVSANLGQTRLAAASGAVFNDANRNGIRDIGEIGLAKQVVFVDHNKNGKLDPGENWTTTTALGYYVLAAPIERSTLRVLAQKRSITAPKRASYLLSPEPGQIITGRDFGVRR